MTCIKFDQKYKKNLNFGVFSFLGFIKNLKNLGFFVPLKNLGFHSHFPALDRDSATVRKQLEGVSRPRNVE